ncbi:hypothetical protein [Terricaulis sp.]|uniref:hypothetical protein n=1 Tax=Terricaulis sp. TaxID=2768686 RepID=UPI0037847CA7
MSAPPKARGAFSPAVMIGIVLVGVFAFSAFMVLSAFAPELQSGNDARAHALSRSAIGYAGAVQLARAATGAEVKIGRVTGEGDRVEALVVLAPEYAVSPDELMRAEGAVTLIILPKWFAMPHPTRRDWVANASTAPPEMVASVADQIVPHLAVSQSEGETRPDLEFGLKTTMRAGPIRNLQTVSGDTLIPVVTDASGRTILGQVRPTEEMPLPIYVLSDPDFLNTQGVADIDTARAGMAMLELALDDRQMIVFDVTMNGLGGSRSALKMAFTPPFLGATLGFAIAALLLGWRAALRFGPSAALGRAIALGKAALAENSAALIRLARREHKLGAGYARLTGVTAAEQAGAGRKSETETAEFLDRVAQANGVESSFTKLSAEAAGAKSSKEMLEAARKLHAWKEEIARATR